MSVLIREQCNDLPRYESDNCKSHKIPDHRQEHNAHLTTNEIHSTLNTITTRECTETSITFLPHPVSKFQSHATSNAAYIHACRRPVYQLQTQGTRTLHLITDRQTDWQTDKDTTVTLIIRSPRRTPALAAAPSGQQQANDNDNDH